MSCTTFYELGCKYTNHKLKNSSAIGMRRFKSFFGITPAVCSVTWDKLIAKLPQGACHEHLLWTLCFLKQYTSEHHRHSIFSADEKTIRKWTWIFIEAIAGLDVIFWEKRLENATPNQTCFVSLDGVDFKILEPSLFDRKWFSHKFSGPGIRYEIGLCIRTGNIIWKNGGYPCGQYPDIRIAREAFIYMLNSDEKTIADKGYRDDKYFILKTNDNKILHKRIMARHETVNRRIKQFNILKNSYRNNIQKHPLVFHAILNLTQLMIENGHPLFMI